MSTRVNTTPAVEDTSAELRFFGTRDDILAMAYPIGKQRADAIMREHPRAPKALLGGGKPGSKEIYSLQAGRQFWLDVATNGIQSKADNGAPTTRK